MTNTEPKKWDFALLKLAVQKVHGPHVAKKAYTSAESITRRMRHMHYHYREVHRLIADPLSEASTGQALSEYVFPGSSVSSDNDVEDRRTKAEAHLLAFVQALHSVEDNLAHVIYYALNLGIDPKSFVEEDKISFYAVKKRLSAGPLKNMMEEMSNDEELEHLRGLVNVSKHRNVVKAGLTVDFVNKKHGMTLAAFSYRGVEYKQVWATDFITSTFNSTQEYVVDIGLQLNKELGVLS